MLSWNRNFRLLAIAVFGSGVFFGVQFSLFHNFIVERIGIEAHELGYMEALREVPGFLNALFIAATILLSPPQASWWSFPYSDGFGLSVVLAGSQFLRRSLSIHLCGVSGSTHGCRCREQCHSSIRRGRRRESGLAV